MAALYLMGIANGASATVLDAVIKLGFWGALLGTFNISVALIVATVVGIRLSLQGAHLPIRTGEMVVAAIYIALLLVPDGAASWMGLTVLAAYDIFRTRSAGARGWVNSVAAASVFIAITGTNLWGKLIAAAFEAPLVSIDAALSERVLRMVHSGEIVRADNAISVDGHLLIVLAGCSSVHAISYGLVCWVALARVRRPEWTWRDIPAALSVCCAVTMLNVVRIAVMALNHHAYLVVHGPVGENAINFGVLAAAALVALYASGAVTSRTARSSRNPIRYH